LVLMYIHLFPPLSSSIPRIISAIAIFHRFPYPLPFPLHSRTSPSFPGNGLFASPSGNGFSPLWCDYPNPILFPSVGHPKISLKSLECSPFRPSYFFRHILFIAAFALVLHFPFAIWPHFAN
jgi:hypothetical protein